MKNNKKTIMIVSIIIGVLVLTIGLTYSIFTISKTGSNSKLVVGDIYMHYKETTNSINLTNQMPLAEKYIVNPNMANQTYQEDTRNELSKCVDVVEGSRFDEGSTAETYCKGTGTVSGETFQTSIDNGDDVSYLKELNIVTSDNKVNPDMVNQTYQKDTRNELSICADSFMANGGPKEVAISLCKGNSLDNGSTLQKAYEQGHLDNMNLTSTFIKENILTLNVTTLPYFEFTIDGKNTTTNKDIWYEIILKHGDDLTGKTRIKDNLLKFTLTETKDGVTSTVFSGETYKDLTSKRVYVNTINRNTTTDVNITYRLYMWISNDTMICAGDPKDNCDYYTDNTPNWNDVFASIKVDVAGDFNEKYVETDASCFNTNIINTYQLNTNMTTEELNKCITYVTDWNWSTGETPEAFCKGTGTVNGNTFQSILDANRFNSDQLSYFKTNNIIINSTTSVEIASYDTSCGTDVVIPREINGYKVTRIANCQPEVTANKTKEVIGNLNYYTNKNYELKNASYKGCGFRGANLTSITIPNGITYIGLLAFSDNQLTSITIPDSVTEIGYNAFSHNQLTSVKLSNNLTTLGHDAFADNQLESVTIPSSLEVIEYNAFHNNQLASVKIEEGVKEINSDAFSYNKITSLEIPDSVTVINYKAFSNNKITSLEIPNSVQYIEEYAFLGNQLANINIHDSVIGIGKGAFNDNKLPDSQAYIYKRTDTNNDGIAEIDKTTVVSYGGANKEITIPSNVTTIVDYAFAYNQLTSVTIPDSVKEISESAFENNQLTNITIGNGIQYIDREAFNKSSFSNPDLQTITINKSCSDIKNIQASSTDTTKYYPWLSYSSPYTAANVTIYGLNNEECDNYRR